MTTRLQAKQYWEARLLQEFLEAQDAMRRSRSEVDRLHSVAHDCGGNVDGAVALARARSIERVAFDQCRRALDAFKDVVVHNKNPDAA
jgi:hypothetical protein